MRSIRRVPSTLNTTQAPASLFKVSKVPTSKTHKQPKNLSTMALLPHLINGSFAPFFTLLDEHDTRRSSYATPTASRSFSPKFNVSEHADYYQLDGEVPGINQKDIEIEFSDEQTISIKGRIRRKSSSTNSDVSNDTNITKQTDDVEDDSDETSSRSSLHATVEDEEGNQIVAADSTPPSKKVTKSHSSVKKTPEVKYWISERSIGEFHRSFKFPSRVDQDKVRASLKDGILSIAVPKAAAPTSKKIRID